MKEKEDVKLMKKNKIIENMQKHLFRLKRKEIYPLNKYAKNKREERENKDAVEEVEEIVNI